VLRSVSLLLFIGLIWGQTDIDKLVLKYNIFKFLPIYARSDSSIYSKTLPDLFIINNQLNNHITKYNKDVRIFSRDFCSPDNRYHTCSKAKDSYNDMMIFPLSETPECIFSFYSSLEYGR